MENVCRMNQLTELSSKESSEILGGYSPAELVGAGIMTGLLFMVAGIPGMAYGYYNYLTNINN